MPYTVTSSTLPSGAPCIRVEGSGAIGKEDADYLLTFIGRNGSMFGLPTLILTQNITSLSADARTTFGAGFDSREDQPWSALVVTNPLIRVTTNFLMRVNGYPKSKMFPKEEDAARWLDERVREDAAKKKAS